MICYFVVVRKHFPLVLSLAVALVASFPCTGSELIRGAEGPHAGEHAVCLPEPLVFDLVRGLGARRSELETNVLGQFTIGGSSNRKIHWAPEVEYGWVPPLGWVAPIRW